MYGFLKQHISIEVIIILYRDVIGSVTIKISEDDVLRSRHVV